MNVNECLVAKLVPGDVLDGLAGEFWGLIIARVDALSHNEQGSWLTILWTGVGRRPMFNTTWFHNDKMLLW